VRLGEAVLREHGSLLFIGLIGGAILALGACLLALPTRIVSRQMVWDLLFNLEGAWHLLNGHQPHVDFHDPLGVVTFALTVIGFKLVGVTPHGFIIGELVAVACLFVAALVAVRGRLPLVPAVLFVAYVGLIVLKPANVGGSIQDFTFAMSYNAIGWSALLVISLILFLPPRDRPASGWLEIVTVALMLYGLFHLKITYFGAAMVEVAAALVISPHIRRRWLPWLAVAVLVVGNAMAPWNAAYVADIFAAVGTGAAVTNPVAIAIMVFANAPELSLFAIALTVAFSLWWTKAAPIALPLAAAVLMLIAGGVLLQNTQERGMVLSTVVAMLLYDHFRGDPATGRPAASKWVLLALLTLPAAGVLKQVTSLSGYAAEAVRGKRLYTFDRSTALGDLAVPIGTSALIDAVGRDPLDYKLFTAIRAAGVGEFELSQYEYGQTLLDAKELFDDPARREGAIVVLDQVNPVSYMLRRKPARGNTLWLDLRFPWRPPEYAFGDATYVLVPKFPLYRIIATSAFDRYGDYLAQQFPVRAENRSWLLYSRR
jgi:hypothetical protein